MNRGSPLKLSNLTLPYDENVSLLYYTNERLVPRPKFIHSLLMADGMTLRSTLLLDFLITEGQELSILSSGLLGGSQLGHLVSNASTLALEDDGSDQTLDLGSLGNGLHSRLLVGHLTTNYIFTDVILLAQIEQLTDFAGALGSQATRYGGVGKAGEGSLASLDNHQGKDRKVRSHDAAAHGLALTLT